MRTATFLGLLVVGAGGGLVASRILGAPGSEAPPNSGAATSTMAAPGASASVSASASATPAGAGGSSSALARLGVGPTGVKVNVDGVEVTVIGGQVVLQGALGSMHRVILRLGRREQTVEVAITEQGPSPNTVTLGRPVAARLAGTTESAATGTTAPPPPTAQPPAKPIATRTGGVGVVETFE